MEAERVKATVALLEKAIAELEMLRPYDFDELKDFLAVSMKVFEIINIAIDLGKELCYYLGVGVPQSYADIFEILKNSRIISKENASKLKRLVVFRNAIVHRYYSITKEDLEKALNELDAVDELIEAALKAAR